GSVWDGCGASPSDAGSVRSDGDDSGSMATIGSAPERVLERATSGRVGRPRGGIPGPSGPFVPNHHDQGSSVPQPGDPPCSSEIPARPAGSPTNDDRGRSGGRKPSGRTTCRDETSRRGGLRRVF